MATSVVGLKTHIWNNRIKSVLFLLLYPIIITPIYISAVALIILQIGFDKNNRAEHIDFAGIMHRVIFEFWYVPYILFAIFLIVIYNSHKNRLDILDDRRVINRNSNPELYTLLENLCISRGIKTPIFFLINNNDINAYTSGLSEATYFIAVTSGLIENLSHEEIECVLAHELTHIINADTSLLFITGSVSDIFSRLSEALKNKRRDSFFEDDTYFLRDKRNINRHNLLSLVFKIGNLGSFLILLFISRKREYLADAGAIELTKNPEAMISALKKIGANEFEMKVNPMSKPSLIHAKSNSWLFSTHPAIEERIKTLEEVNRIAPQQPEVPILDEKAKKKLEEGW